MHVHGCFAKRRISVFALLRKLILIKDFAINLYTTFMQGNLQYAKLKFKNYCIL